MAENAHRRAGDPAAVIDSGKLITAENIPDQPDRQGALRRTLEQACAESRCRPGALTVLAVQNDPFRLDTPAGHRDGAWLAMQAERHGLAHRKIHLRGFHYLLVSTSGLVKPNGKPYTNTEPDWCWLVNHAAKAARFLRYIRFDQIVDARNAEPAIRIREPKSGLPPQPWISVGLNVEVPEAVDLQPHVDVDWFRVDQPYRLVFYGEKTSLEDVLAPVADYCGADLFLPSGEISDSLLHQMAAAGAADGRPMVVLCFSDCDPSGWQMPISIARKLQAFKALLFPKLEFQVRRVALTPEQVKLYGLPSTPLKATERRADKWQAAMGVAQTEIDALLAGHRDVLERMARDAVKPFFDPTLARRCRHAQAEWRGACQEAIDEQTDQDHLDRIAEQANEALDQVREQIASLGEQIRIDPGGYRLPPRPPMPEPVLTVEPDSKPLIDSAWSFAEQSRRLVASKAYDGADAP
jgi:hypothetical protein